MATLSSHVYLSPIKSSSMKENGPMHHKHKNNIKVNGGTASMLPTKAEGGQSHINGVAATTDSVAPVGERGRLDVLSESRRQNIPTKKQTSDPFRQGVITDGSIGYRQTVVIRSYEVGVDKTATLETIFNLLQETALNHVWMTGLLSAGFGATHAMMRNNLIWVVKRIQLEVDTYPIWGEVVEINTWVAESGRNGMRRDWSIRSHLSGHVFARATSTWAMMDQKTRRLSKMPGEVKAEILPWFNDKHALQEDLFKIIKLDDNAKYVTPDLKPKRSDLDMNQHVNNVKYVRWMLEAIPELFLESHQLSSIKLEYKRECGSSDIVQSLCDPDEDPTQEASELDMIRGFIFEEHEHGFLDHPIKWPLSFTHLLQTKGEPQKEEIVRGRTTWKKKLPVMPFST
ncbi:hypothetical protein AAC387_Pa05g3273 [Persea americana]